MTEQEQNKIQALVDKLAADQRAAMQLLILTRGRAVGCRVCRKKPDPGDPPILDIEREYCRNGHHFAPLSPDTARMLAGEIFNA